MPCGDRGAPGSVSGSGLVSPLRAGSHPQRVSGGNCHGTGLPAGRVEHRQPGSADFSGRKHWTLPHPWQDHREPRQSLLPAPDQVKDIDPGVVPWGLGTVPERHAINLLGSHQPSPPGAGLPEQLFLILQFAASTNHGDLGTAETSWTRARRRGLAGGGAGFPWSGRPQAQIRGVLQRQMQQEGQALGRAIPAPPASDPGGHRAQLACTLPSGAPVSAWASSFSLGPLSLAGIVEAQPAAGGWPCTHSWLTHGPEALPALLNSPPSSVWAPGAPAPPRAPGSLAQPLSEP